MTTERITLHDLARLVRDMRAAQRGYFKTQPGTAEKFKFLDESKRLEKLVDRAVAETLDDQGKLFGAEGEQP